VGDDYEIEQDVAHHDQVDATQLRTDAGELRTEAQHDYNEAASMGQMGLPSEEIPYLTEAIKLETRAADFEQRASQLDQGGQLNLAARDHLVERDTAQAGAAAAEAHAAGAQVVLDFAELTEQDRTRWAGEAGAATGEAAALHKRADELTEQAIGEIHEATADESAARDGLGGRHWDGVGRPPGQESAAE
jgi:hypothetical protein